MLDQLEEISRVELPSGDVAIVGRIKGRHITKAGQLMGGDQSKYMVALMHLSVMIGGSQQPIEFYEDLDAGPFMAIQEEIGKQFEGKNP